MADTNNPFAGAVFDETEEKANPFEGINFNDDAPTVVEEPEDKSSDLSVFDDESLIGESIDLPLPNTTMYDDITNEGSAIPGSGGRSAAFDVAMQRYNFYADHPESRRQLDGTVVYKNKVVPFPDQSFFKGNMGVGTSQKMVGGIKNAGVELLGVGEMATDLAGITNPETSYIQDNFAKLSPGDSGLDSLVIEGSSLITGGGLAAKLAGYIPKISKLPYVGTVLKGLGFEIGAASSIDADSGTLLIGENALAKDLGFQGKIFEGIEVDGDANKAQQELTKRLNILADGMTAAGVVTGAVKGIDFGARTIYNLFIDPIAKAGSISKVEEEYVSDLLESLVNVGDDPKAIEAARLKVTELIKANKDLYVDMPKELADDVAISLDTMSALEKALQGDKTDEARNIIIKAQGIKRGALQNSQGNNQLNIAVAGPTDEFDRVLTEAESNLGGSKAIDQTRLALQEQGVSEIDDAALTVVKAEDSIENLNVRIMEELKENPSIIGKVTEIEARTGFDIGSVRETSADAIVSNLSKASEAMDNTKNELFSAIEGGVVDYNDMISTLKNLKPEQLDKAASAMPGNAQFGTLLEQIKLRSTMVDGVAVQETVEEMQQRVAGWATRNELDFSRLFTDIRPGLVDSINSLELGNAAEKGAAKTLIQFKKWIDEDAIKYLRENGDEETLEAAEEAMRYFKDEWAPFWDDGSTLQQIGTLRRQTTARGKQGSKFDDEARAQVKGVINNDNRSVAANMVKLLDRPEGGQSASDVTDYIIGDVLTTLSSRLDTAENVSDIGLSAVRESLSGYATLLRKSFGQEADKLDDLVLKLGDNKITKENLQKELVVAQRLAKQAEERIYNVELNGFFKANGVPNPNGYDTLAKIFNNQQSADQISNLMARAEGDPIIEKGIQAAYSRWFRNNILGSTTSTAGDRTIKAGVDMANREGIKNAVDYANIVFENKPVFVEALNTLLSEAGMVQRSRASKAIPTGSGTAELTEQIAAVNRGVTMVFGVLSRIGAKIRATAVGGLQQKFNKENYFNMVDSLLANPDEFIRVVENVVRTEKAKGTIPIRIPFTKGKKIPEGVPGLGGKEPVYYLDRGSLYKMMVRAGVYREGNAEDERNFVEQMADIELELTKGIDNAVEQTDRMLMPQN